MATQHDPPKDAEAPRPAGAPFPEGALDPDLIKLRRPRPKVGMVTAAGILLLCVLFWVRLGPDRRFGASSTTPRAVAVGDVLEGKVATDQLIEITAEPLLGNAVRASTRKGATGLRAVPAQGTGDRLWLLLPGDGLSPASEPPVYRGRLRLLEEMPVADDLQEFLARHPRPVFATPAAIRAALPGGPLKTVTGDAVTMRDTDEVSVDVLDLQNSLLVAPVSERFPEASAWQTALTAAGMHVTLLPPPQSSPEVARFAVALSSEAALKLLEQAGLWTVRAEPVLRTHRGTWAQLRTSSADALTFGEDALADQQIDLVGLFIARGLPPQSFALITEETPADYWYVRPISISLLVLGVLFAWILAQAVRRDLLPIKSA